MIHKALLLALSLLCGLGLLSMVMVFAAEAGSSATETLYIQTLPMVEKDYPQLTIWHMWTDAVAEEYADALLDYSLANPDISVQMVYIPDMWSALETAIPAGTGPDIVLYANDNIGWWATYEYIEPLNQWISQTYMDENFEPASVDGVTWNGQIWGIPDSTEGIALVYNRDIITDTDVPAPDDFTGLLSKAAEFRSTHPEQYYLCNQGLGYSDAYHVSPIYFGFGLDAYGGYVGENGTAYMTTTEAITAAEWIYDFSSFSPVTTSHQICRDMLVNGEAAIWWTGPWAISDLRDQGINIGIAPMGSPFVGIKNFLMTTNAVDRGKADMTIDLMKYLGSFEVQKRVTLTNHTIPANTAALNDPEVQAIYDVAQFGASLNLGTPMGNHIYVPCQWAPVGEATLAIWDGSMTPEEAMYAAQAAIEDCVGSIGP